MTGTQNIRQNDNDAIVDAMKLKADDVIGHKVVCPVCEDKVFKKWPLGWDAHAAYRCKGLPGNNLKQRKKEYKTKTHHLFR